MVYAMRRGTVDYALQSPPFPDGLRMHKELVQQVEPIAKGNKGRRKPGEGQWKKEEWADHRAQSVETIRRGQVDIGTRMVDEMKGPERMPLMGKPVKPVVSEVGQQKTGHKCPDRSRQMYRCDFGSSLQDKQLITGKQVFGQLKANQDNKIGKRVFQTIGLLVPPPAPDDLCRDQQGQENKDRDGMPSISHDNFFLKYYPVKMEFRWKNCWAKPGQTGKESIKAGRRFRSVVRRISFLSPASSGNPLLSPC